MTLKRLREARGLSQQQLADKAGVDHTQISRVESGERPIGRMGYYRVVRLGRVLVPGTPVEEVFPVPTSSPSLSRTTA
jgi:transcriptional regulator with XRE-family HTH domain